MYMPYFPPPKLRARRRSRCPQCDEQMTKQSRQSWWCRRCQAHGLLRMEPVPVTAPDPLEDDSRWTILSARFDQRLVQQMFTDMFEEWVESLPADDPARILYDLLPKPPRPS